MSRPTSIDVREWQASGVTLALVWETGEGDARLRGWAGDDGLRAIETNAATVWSEAADLDHPFDAYWDARSLDGEVRS